jgi:hypothetical protein
MQAQTESLRQADAAAPLGLTLKWPRPGEAIDPTLILPSGPAKTGADRRSPLGAIRAAAVRWWRRFAGRDGQSTTEWLMIAGILSAIGIFLVGVMPHALGVFMKSMAMSLRTVAP